MISHAHSKMLTLLFSFKVHISSKRQREDSNSESEDTVGQRPIRHVKRKLNTGFVTSFFHINIANNGLTRTGFEASATVTNTDSTVGTSTTACMSSSYVIWNDS